MQNRRVIKKLSNGMLWSQQGAMQNCSTVRVTGIRGAKAGATAQNKEPHEFVKKCRNIEKPPQMSVFGPPCGTMFSGVVSRLYPALFSHLHDFGKIAEICQNDEAKFCLVSHGPFLQMPSTRLWFSFSVFHAGSILSAPHSGSQWLTLMFFFIVSASQFLSCLWF